VNPDKQIYHCFGCGAGGDVIGFIQKIENMSFPEALEFLAKRVHFELPKKNFENPARREAIKNLELLHERTLTYYRKLFLSTQGQVPRDYLEKRNFKKEVLDIFEVGFAPDAWRGLTDTLSREGFSESLLLKSGLVNRSPKGSLYDVFRGRILFPIRSVQGRVIGFGGRIINPEGKPKYLNSPETDLFKKGRELFALNIAKKHLINEEHRLFIVEGYLDCVKMHEAGIQNTVATLGTALTPDHVKLLRRYAEEAILVFDGDKAGVSAAFRSLDVFLEEGFPVKIVSLEDGMDPDDYIQKKGAPAFIAKLNSAKDFFEFKLEILSNRYSKKDSLGLLKITASFLEIIGKMPNEILQDHYLRKLSSALHINESSLRQEFEKVKKKTLPNRGTPHKLDPGASKNTLSSPTHQKEEIHLLYLLAEEEGPEVIGQVEASLFLNSITQRVFEVLKEVRAEHPTGSCLTNFLARIEEEELKRKIVELTFVEWNPEKRQKALADSLRHLKRSHIQAEQKALEAKIRSAEANGEFESLEKYLRDFQQLSGKGKK